MAQQDFVVVGAASAGCVPAHGLLLAARRLLLQEAGRPDEDRFIHMPATFVRV